MLKGDSNSNQEPKLKLELIIGDGSAEMHNASLPIRWCLDQNTISALKDRGVHDPHILLVVLGHGHYGRNEKRYLIPLGEMMTYISFYCPGVNKVYGSIVSSTNNRGGKELRDFFLTRTNLSYDTDVIYSDGTMIPYRCFCSTMQKVVIPQELFANPPEWERKWVNLWFRSRPIDECDYRRRRVFAYTVQPIPMATLVAVIGIATVVAGAVVSVAKILYALFLLSLGVKKVNLEPIVQPLEMNVTDVRVYRSGTWTLAKWKWGRAFFLLPFTPLYVLLAFCGVFLFFSMGDSTADWREAIFITALYAVLLPFTLLLCFYWRGKIWKFNIPVFSSMKERIVEWMKKWGQNKEMKLRKMWNKEKSLQAARRSLQYSAMEVLLCKDGPAVDLRADITALPKEKRSLRLHFYAIKAKICRPFAA